MQSFIVGLRQNGIRKKHPGIVLEEVLRSGLLPTDLKKNDPVCPLVYTKLDSKYLLLSLRSQISLRSIRAYSTA